MLGKLIYCHLWDSGKSGRVFIDSVGDRSCALQLKNAKGGKYHRVFNYYNTYNILELLNETVIVWPGGTQTAPIGRPKCGFDNEFCSSTTDAKGEILFCNVSTIYIKPSPNIIRCIKRNIFPCSLFIFGYKKLILQVIFCSYQS